MKAADLLRTAGTLLGLAIVGAAVLLPAMFCPPFGTDACVPTSFPWNVWRAIQGDGLAGIDYRWVVRLPLAALGVAVMLATWAVVDQWEVSSGRAARAARG